MPQIIILPNEEFCPEGVVINADKGTSICRALLANDIEI
ncbi:MAG: ISC system 2Fe-2S type ferredoxin, partial [Gammaproteobacteria bacterium]